MLSDCTRQAALEHSECQQQPSTADPTCSSQVRRRSQDNSVCQPDNNEHFRRTRQIFIPEEKRQFELSLTYQLLQRQGRPGSLMASSGLRTLDSGLWTLDSGSNDLGSLCCVLSQCLFPARSKWVPASCQGNLTEMLECYLRWTSIPCI